MNNHSIIYEKPEFSALLHTIKKLPSKVYPHLDVISETVNDLNRK